ncbi:uncharacterized protein TRIVIDRAFT_226980 [Trichoderma virens Gv29-8]|uniref:Uncharacterized protein n=1 Tax=Hypocrea virens (strain Gv29-8 / FGSC 10586) TaxID=413071 RepID=G9N826_HYPVG|nr:uncharacterized protein TRIVIDRAFT_226980 [Trichoderma virens Gv29-8]EHK17137.1 hypothetical protein TRIVIDRAFT_226980 [Trichoderma virens Gv29-8]UKZ55554.1 hypothetical protein TrVGV298_009378 [Trichoderma virens]
MPLPPPPRAQISGFRGAASMWSVFHGDGYDFLAQPSCYVAQYGHKVQPGVFYKPLKPLLRHAMGLVYVFLGPSSYIFLELSWG